MANNDTVGWITGTQSDNNIHTSTYTTTMYTVILELHKHTQPYQILLLQDKLGDQVEVLVSY